MTPHQEALQHLIWAAVQGIRPHEVCASLGFEMPLASAEIALMCLETVALEWREQPELRAVQ